ncbi:tyrosine-type recombinase/integrase [Hymenobacter sp. YC55]|uniref:tyrosine-type recombinase/integrase n=1 Tax=Hymenobacter sp. YC55 TaxID=3034019 RepID=UPI0023F9BA46|nr:tyrosine-type recombinase/integrase [Hymenobacter sp. YC55]MDF7810523.1 tyrosine-type recombinase/integrase [Hymenobacter sp. YC55]
MNYSASIKLRRPARTDGTCQILLLVVIRRKPHPLGLGISWWPELFDEQKGLCLTGQAKKDRKPGYDQVLSTAVAWAGGTIEKLEAKAKDHNMIIGKARSKANDVFVNFRLNDQPVTSEAFLLDYNTEASKKDFISYMEAKISERYRKGKGHREGIGEVTRKNHTSTLNCLKKFRPSIPFYSISPKLVDDLHAFMCKHIKGINTRWTRHKDVKTYLALAKKERIRFEDPYVDFENKSVEGTWKPLKSAELMKLKVYYTQLPVGSARRRILQRFLFSCCSSLRLGDLKNLHQAKLNGQELTFQIQKTYDEKLKAMMLPLTKEALGYLEDSRREEGLVGFWPYTDQYSNRTLKDIAKELDIETHLHHHVGRETYATEFIRRGGKVEVLQKLMDHEKIETTMKYVHVDDDMKREAIRMLDAQNEVQMAVVA